MPDFSGQTKLKMTQAKVKSMLRRTSYAVSTDENRYVLNGLYFSFKENKLTIVATDGRRLALAEEDLELPEGSQTDSIVPTKAIQELARLLGDEGEVELQLTDNQVSFTLNTESNKETLIVSKLVEGAYPNYKQVIPAESKYRVTMDKEELQQALRRAEIMTSDKSNSVKMTFSENNLTITSNSPEVGESRETMAINYAGEEVSIAFNPAFFIDPLKALDEEEVHFEFTDQLSPGVVKTNHPFLYVIMPMRTTSSLANSDLVMRGMLRGASFFGPIRSFPAVMHPKPISRILKNVFFVGGIDVGHDVFYRPRKAVFMSGNFRANL